MPIGVITDALAVALGGLLGGILQKLLDERIQHGLNLIFGICSICLGIVSVILMENMPVVMLAIILGSGLGLLIRLGDRISSGTAHILRAMHMGGAEDGGQPEMMTAIVLFCVSGTGIYGAIVEGFLGDHSIMLAKAIMDFFTAAIFACSLGKIISLVSIPQAIVYLTLFALAGLIYPITTTAMIADFKACGGAIMLATGFRIARICDFPIADMIPAMALAMPISWLWTACAVPLLG